MGLFSRQSKSTSQYEKRPAFSRPSVHFISSGRQDFPDRSAAERSIASKPQQKRPAFSRPSVHFISSGRQDSNLRSPGPKPGAVTGLGHAPSAVSGGKDSPNYSVCNFTRKILRESFKFKAGTLPDDFQQKSQRNTRWLFKAERLGLEPRRRLPVDRLAICSVTTPAPLLLLGHSSDEAATKLR